MAKDEKTKYKTIEFISEFHRLAVMPREGQGVKEQSKTDILILHLQTLLTIICFYLKFNS